MKQLSLLIFCLCVLTSSCRKSTATSANESVANANESVTSTFYDSRKATKANGSSTAETTRAKITAYELPAPLNDRPEQILRRKGYTTSYNSQTRCPNWVAWHLTKGHTYGSHQRSGEVFSEDTDVSPRATDNDYFNSRYDRGHMCPAGDNKWDAQAMRESFLFTNICPQNHNLNKYEWNSLEMLCRDWARKYGAIDIVCGPVYNNGTQAKTIGRGRVRVPDAFFKVVMCRSNPTKAIGFVMNNDGKKISLSSTACTVDDVERLTGIDFYPALDDKTENRIEAHADFGEW